MTPDGHETWLSRLTYQLKCADVLIGWAAILAVVARYSAPDTRRLTSEVY